MDVKERAEGLWPQGGTPAEAFLFEQGALMRAAKAMFQRRAGVSDARMHVLGVLARFGEMSQNELQRRLNVNGAAVTRQVKQLEADGLLSRRTDPNDNRFTLVMVTPEGREALREVARTMREFLTQALEGVSEEDLACMRRAMARMRANLEKM
jgi:DNA-binding MarR family transcriptional regulator